MENRLKNHIETIFNQMPQSQATQEIKEEMLQNLIDKYNDLVAQGKSEEEAYSITVASIGDISGLFQQQSTISPQEMEKQKHKSALLTSVSIMLYILCVVPCIIFSFSSNVMLTAVAGPVLMFVIIAVATGLLIYNNKTKPRYNQNNQTMVNEFKQWQQGNTSQSSKFKSITSVLWSITVVAYFIISFLTGAWHITWILFLITVAIQEIIKLCITIKN